MTSSHTVSVEKSKVVILLHSVTAVMALIGGLAGSDFSLRIAQAKIEIPSVPGLLNLTPLLVATLGLILAIAGATYILFTINEWLKSLSMSAQNKGR